MRPRPVLLTPIILVVVLVALGTPALAGASRSGARHGLGGVPGKGWFAWLTIGHRRQ